MDITRQVVVFDAADVGVESAFWADVFDRRVVEDNDDGWPDEEALRSFLSPPGIGRPSGQQYGGGAYDRCR